MVRPKRMSRKVRELLGSAESDAKHHLSTDLGCMAIGDTRDLVHLLPKNCIDAIVTSPPYFDLKDYGEEHQIGTGQVYEEYLDDLDSIFSKIYKACKDNGSLWLVLDTFTQERKTILLPFELANKLELTGWNLEEVIIWQKDRTVPWSSPGRFRKSFEYILMFSKSPDFKFYGNRLRETLGLKRWWIRYPERYHPEGKMPTDVWYVPLQFQGAWGGKDYPRHLCPFPFELVDRILTVSTNKSNFVFDPFAGTGSVLAQAHSMDRCYLGFELKEDFLIEFEQKTLPAALKRMGATDRKFSGKNFKSLIMMLRGMKFCSQLIKEYRKASLGKSGEATLPYCAVVIFNKRDLSNPRIPLPLTFQLYWHNELSIEQDEIIQKLTSCQPLSTFEISASIANCYSVDDLESVVKENHISNFYSYTVGNTHNHTGLSPLTYLEKLVVEKKEIPIRRIPIVSNVPLSVEIE